MKAKKLNKRDTGAQKGSIVADEDEDEETGAEQIEAVDATLGTTGTIPVVEEIKDSDVVPQTANISDSDTLEIVFLEELFDYPVVGKYSFLEEHGVTRIRRHQKFTVPRNVALTLLDKRLVTIPSRAV